MQFAESGRVPTVRVESESACLESESRCEGLESESESSKIGTRVRLESESKDSSPHLWRIGKEDSKAKTFASRLVIVRDTREPGARDFVRVPGNEIRDVFPEGNF